MTVRSGALALLLALGVCAYPLLSHPAQAQGYTRVTACGDPAPPAGNGNGYMDIHGNICVGANVTANATTTATASATPTAVLAGTGKPLNIDLFSEMFVQPAFAGTPVDGTHGLPVNCIVGCAGGPLDESTFTPGTTSITTGGFFQTTAGANPLTTGQAGSVQMTSTRSFFVNLRNAAGAEEGIAALPLQVSLANTAANGTAVLVTGTGGTFPISGATSNASSAVATSSTNIPGVAYNYGFNGATWDQLQVDASKFLKVNCATGCAGGSTSNATSGVATSSTNGATVAYNYGFNGTTWDQLQVDGSKNLKVSIAAALPAGTAVIGHVIADTGSTTTVTGNVTAVQATGSNLHIVCDSGCSSSTAPADEAAFTAGTTSQSPVGGFFQTTATSNPLTTGQMGAFQVTTNRALFTNLRNASGTEIGTTANPINDNVAQVNGVTTLAGAGATGTGSQRVTAAQDTTTIAGSAPGTAGSASANVVTVQGVASMTKLLVTPDSVALPANQSVNVAQVGGTNTVNGGVAGSQSVGGTVATNVAITANPLNLGAQAVSSENTAVTTARQVQLVADLVGKLIVLPYANPENFVSGVITSAMTATTSTSLIAAPAAGLRNYITQCTFSNSHATQGTMMILQDGSGGTTIYSGPAAPAFGGATITFPTPLRQPTTATALFVQNVTTGANTFAACSGYKGA